MVDMTDSAKMNADEASPPRTSAGAQTLFKGLEVLSRVAKGYATTSNL